MARYFALDRSSIRSRDSRIRSRRSSIVSAGAPEDKFEGDQKDAGFQQHIVGQASFEKRNRKEEEVSAMITDQRSKCLKRELPASVSLGH